MTKWKLTYLTNGFLNAVIVDVHSEYDLQTVIASNGMFTALIKMERILEASEDNIQDMTA